MTLQSSGPISLLDVQSEFGGSNPIGINEYYGVAAGVPASGTISLADFYGKSGPPFTWPVDYLGSGALTNTPSSYNGTVRTPGTSASPVTYTIQIDVSDQGGACTLQYYVGGTLNQTWTRNTTPFFSTTYTSTFGSNSIQFRTIDMIDSGTGGDITYAAVKVAAVQVFYCSFQVI
jgi:hypothetical protein